MDIKTQMIVRSNPNLYRFLREESYWYKYLNRSPNYLKDMEQAMKSKYKLTAQDKLEKLNQSMGLIHSLMDVLK